MLRNIFTRAFVIFFVLSCLSACASIYTLTAEPEEIHKDLCTNSCSVIPRIYSGTVMDFCGAFLEDGGQGAAIMFYDLFLSIPVDTIVLPYTIYSQFMYGNILELNQCESNKVDSEVALKLGPF